jgi:hypothetical protein
MALQNNKPQLPKRKSQGEKKIGRLTPRLIVGRNVTSTSVFKGQNIDAVAIKLVRMVNFSNIAQLSAHNPRTTSRALSSKFFFNSPALPLRYIVWNTDMCKTG